MPSPFKYTVCKPPAEIPTTPLSGLPDPSTTCTGLLLFVVVPSQLAPKIVTHRPDRAVPLQIDRVIIIRGDPHHPAQRIARSIHHLHRVASIRGGTVPQLVPKISTHRPDRAGPFKYTVCEPPAEIPTTPLSGLPDPSTTCTGLLLFVVVPSPSRP